MPELHSIEQAVFDISFDSIARSETQHTQLAGFIREQILRLTDEVFGEFSDGESTIRIDVLEVDLGEIPYEGFQGEMETRFREKLASVLREKIRKISPSEPTDGNSFAGSSYVENLSGENSSGNSLFAGGSSGEVRLNRQQQELELLQRYLQNGVMPGKLRQAEANTAEFMLRRCMVESPTALRLFLINSSEKEMLARRLAQQFPEDMLHAVMQLLSPQHAQTLQDLLRELGQLVAADLISVSVAEFRLLVRERLLAELMLANATSLTAEEIFVRAVREGFEHYAKPGKVIEDAQVAGRLSHHVASQDLKTETISVPTLAGNSSAGHLSQPNLDTDAAHAVAAVDDAVATLPLHEALAFSARTIDMPEESVTMAKADSHEQSAAAKEQMDALENASASTLRAREIASQTFLMRFESAMLEGGVQLKGMDWKGLLARHGDAVRELMLRHLGEARTRIRMVTSFTGEMLGDLMRLLSPVAADFIIPFAAQPELQLSSSAGRSTPIFWQHVFAYLHAKPRQEFVRDDFVGSTVSHLSQHGFDAEVIRHAAQRVAASQSGHAIRPLQQRDSDSPAPVLRTGLAQGDAEKNISRRDAGRKNLTIGDATAAHEEQGLDEQALWLRVTLEEALVQGAADKLIPLWHAVLTQHAALLCRVFRERLGDEYSRRKLARGFPQEMLLGLAKLLVGEEAEYLARVIEATAESVLEYPLPLTISQNDFDSVGRKSLAHAKDSPVETFAIRAELAEVQEFIHGATDLPGADSHALKDGEAIAAIGAIKAILWQYTLGYLHRTLATGFERSAYREGVFGFMAGHGFRITDAVQERTGSRIEPYAQLPEGQLVASVAEAAMKWEGRADQADGVAVTAHPPQHSVLEGRQVVHLDVTPGSEDAIRSDDLIEARTSKIAEDAVTPYLTIVDRLRGMSQTDVLYELEQLQQHYPEGMAELLHQLQSGKIVIEYGALGVQEYRLLVKAFIAKLSGSGANVRVQSATAQVAGAAQATPFRAEAGHHYELQDDGQTGNASLARNEFWYAVESQAKQAQSVHHYYQYILQHLIAGQAVDLEAAVMQISAQQLQASVADIQAQGISLASALATSRAHESGPDEVDGDITAPAISRSAVVESGLAQSAQLLASQEKNSHAGGTLLEHETAQQVALSLDDQQLIRPLQQRDSDSPAPVLQTGLAQGDALESISRMDAERKNLAIGDATESHEEQGLDEQALWLRVMLEEALVQGAADKLIPLWHALLTQYAALVRRVFQERMGDEYSRSKLARGFPQEMLLGLANLLVGEETEYLMRMIEAIAGSAPIPLLAGQDKEFNFTRSMTNSAQMDSGSIPADSKRANADDLYGTQAETETLTTSDVERPEVAAIRAILWQYTLGYLHRTLVTGFERSAYREGVLGYLSGHGFRITDAVLESIASRIEPYAQMQEERVAASAAKWEGRTGQAEGVDTAAHTAQHKQAEMSHASVTTALTLEQGQAGNNAARQYEIALREIFMSLPGDAQMHAKQFERYSTKALRSLVRALEPVAWNFFQALSEHPEWQMQHDAGSNSRQRQFWLFTLQYLRDSALSGFQRTQYTQALLRHFNYSGLDTESLLQAVERSAATLPQATMEEISMNVQHGLHRKKETGWLRDDHFSGLYQQLLERLCGKQRDRECTFELLELVSVHPEAVKELYQQLLHGTVAADVSALGKQEAWHHIEIFLAVHHGSMGIEFRQEIKSHAKHAHDLQSYYQHILENLLGDRIIDIDSALGFHAAEKQSPQEIPQQASQAGTATSDVSDTVAGAGTIAVMVHDRVAGAGTQQGSSLKPQSGKSELPADAVAGREADAVAGIAEEAVAINFAASDEASDPGAIEQRAALYQRVVQSLRNPIPADGGAGLAVQQLQQQYPSVFEQLWHDLRAGIIPVDVRRLVAEDARQLVLAIAGSVHSGQGHFLQAIESYAQRASDVQSYYRYILEKLLADQLVDLEIAAQSNEQTVLAGDRQNERADAGSGIVAVAQTETHTADQDMQHEHGIQSGMPLAAQKLYRQMWDRLSGQSQQDCSAAIDELAVAYPAALEALYRQLQAGDIRLWINMLNAREAQRLVFAVAQLDATAASSGLISAVERGASLAGNLQRYYQYILERLIRNQNIDLELALDVAAAPAMPVNIQTEQDDVSAAVDAIGNANEPVASQAVSVEPPATEDASGRRAVPEPLGKDDDGAANSPGKTYSAQEWKDGTEIYIANAGMVLLSPYLPRLFTMLELNDGKQFKDWHATERAIHLLQYTVNESCDSPEFLLALNKLLCGVEGGIPIVREIKLEARDQETIEGMLKAVIQQWSIIGNTSIQGLRESFLQRAGRLQRKGENWHLKVESKGIDVLIDRLPWSFSVIKYAWMKRPIYVEWR